MTPDFRAAPGTAPSASTAPVPHLTAEPSGTPHGQSPVWPREESNLRTRIRSPLLYPLSYGASRQVCHGRASYPVLARGGGSSVGRAPGCGPGGRGFESPPPPLASSVREGGEGRPHLISASRLRGPRSASSRPAPRGGLRRTLRRSSS